MINIQAMRSHLSEPFLNEGDRNFQKRHHPKEWISSVSEISPCLKYSVKNNELNDVGRFGEWQMSLGTRNAYGAIANT